MNIILFLTEAIPLCTKKLHNVVYPVYTQLYKYISKGKVIPLQARCGPEGG